MIENETTGYLLWPNLLKICAISWVVLIHSAAPLLIGYPELGPVPWWSGNLYDSFGRWCIPIFLMLSGTFVIEKAKRDPWLFFRRRCRRLLLPFLIWSGIYLLWRVYANGEDISLQDFPGLVLKGPVFYHLWFLYVLIGLYLLAPILGVYLAHASAGNSLYLVALWLLLGSVLPMLESWFAFSHYLSGGGAHSLFSYLGYFVLGYLLRDRMPVKSKGILFGMFLLGFLVTALGTWYLTVVRNAGEFDGLFYEFFSTNVFLMAVPVYLAGKGFAPPQVAPGLKEGVGRVSVLAVCVPGIYLIHPLVISSLKRGMWGFTLDQTTLYPPVGVPFFAAVVMAVSFVAVLIIRRIPVLRYVFP